MLFTAFMETTGDSELPGSKHSYVQNASSNMLPILACKFDLLLSLQNISTLKNSQSI
jgi:hypothetical protein